MYMYEYYNILLLVVKSKSINATIKRTSLHLLTSVHAGGAVHTDKGQVREWWDFFICATKLRYEIMSTSDEDTAGGAVKCSVHTTSEQY